MILNAAAHYQFTIFISLFRGMARIFFWMLAVAAVLNNGAAPAQDSLFAVRTADGAWRVPYKTTAAHRSVFAVSRATGVPAAILADANRLGYGDTLAAGRELQVPLGFYNWYNYTPPEGTAFNPVYYRAEAEDTWTALARAVGVATATLQDWNDRRMAPLQPGDVVMIGWYGVGRSSAPPVVEIPADTVLFAEVDTAAPVRVVPPMEQAFLDQTTGGNVLTERGAAAFFPAAGGTSRGVHYAFHNTASRGTVLRVFNPGTARTVYVKVIGPMPATRQYVGAIVGLSAATRGELGVRGDARAWCEVSWAGY